MYQLIVDASVEEEGELPQSTFEEFQDCPEKLEEGEREVESIPLMLSLHALKGSQRHNTMRLTATIGQHEVIALVDSSSTHSFMDCHLLKRLQVIVDQPCRLRVNVVNGVHLVTQGVCSTITWEVQGHRFTTDLWYFLSRDAMLC